MGVEPVQIELSRRLRFEGALGHDGMIELYEGWEEAWEGTEHQLDELFDLGTGALFLGALHGRGEASGAEVAQPYSNLITYQSAKAIRSQFFLSWEEGLRAAGIGELRPPE